MEIELVQGKITDKKTISPSTTAADLARSLQLTAPHEALCCRVNGDLVDLPTILQEGDRVEFISFDDRIGKDVYWHTSAHVLAQAVLRLWPEAQPTIGPSIEEGFYYDFADLTISDEDFPKIEKEMKKIIAENHKPERHIFKDASQAIQTFSGNPYKKELIEEIAPKGGELTAYSQGEFSDLCRGPHLPSLSKIKAISVLKTSGAYWRGDANNPMLTRIYGISFPSKEMLKEYFHKIEEAKKRDHKILGPKLGLFLLREEAPGMPFIQPKGMVVWNRLIDYWRECHKRAGYVEIKTPTLMVRTLWERSGHWENYRENMFTSTIEKREFAIKPMNCPGGMLLYGSTGHSYRELPLKVAEIGLCHRYEHSGALSGLFRVRCFHMDDAHIFMQREDIQTEIQGVLSLADEIYQTFGLSYTLVLSTRPEAHTIGTDEEWEATTAALKNALDATGTPYEIAEGDGAFYGPKIDFKLHDALGRKWQCGTVQLDMSLPERFDLEYTATDGTKRRPVIAHRAIYGSIERFFGALIEFYAGKFPLWLSPSQIYLLPVADRHHEYAEKLRKRFVDLGFETFVDSSAESVSKKVRTAQLELYNYILTVGDREVEEQNISLRTRDGVVHGAMDVTTFVKTICKERDEKMLASPFTC
jgi:threonyl-tRNA synthetase